jgi:RND family efflux transporter MFP subunit
MSRKIKIIIFIIIGVFILGLILFIFVGKNRIEEKNIINSYNFLKVEKGDVEQTVKVDGTVVATKEVDLRFQANGVIEKSNYKIGEEVKKGDVLASLYSRDQEIAVRQREAGLAQAEANLNLVLVGAGDADVMVYQSKIDNAKKIIETTKNSTQEDIKNSEARVASAQIALDNAIENLSIKEKQNNIDLQIAYEGARSAINSSLLIIEKTLDDINDILEDDDLDNSFSVKDSKYERESNSKYYQIINSFKTLSDKNKDLNNSDYQEIDNLIKETKENLINTQSLLDSVFNGLVATVTSSSLTQAELELHKTSVNNMRTGIITSLNGVENKEQFILQTKTSSIAGISNAKALIDTARATLDLEKASLYSVSSKADTQIVQAENSFVLAENELSLKTSKPRDVDIAYLKAKVYEASTLLSLAQENLKKTILLSPVDGVIVSMEFEIGESINSSDIFVKLTADEKKIEADIPEIEIGKVAINDKVNITLDAFINKTFNGSIISIDPVETNIQGVVYYKADIYFDDASSSKMVFPGMTASINISTDSRANVLVLPNSSVKKEDNRFFIQVLENEKIKFRDVVVGLVGDNKTEIISGLTEGEQIVDFVLKSN